MKISYIREIIGRLKWEYDKPERKTRIDAVAVLIQTILSQNTSDNNSGRAFSNLIKTYKSWDRVAVAPLHSIAEAIRGGGLAEVKARYIKSSLVKIKRIHGKIDLLFLSQMPMDMARNWLLQLPGVGLKTANCVLLFSSGMPALPVDTHIYRVARRLGLIEKGASIEQAHSQLAKIVPSEEVFSFHVLMIEHGRRICKARIPECQSCIFTSFCPTSGTA